MNHKGKVREGPRRRWLIREGKKETVRRRRLGGRKFGKFFIYE